MARSLARPRAENAGVAGHNLTQAVGGAVDSSSTTTYRSSVDPDIQTDSGQIGGACDGQIDVGRDDGCQSLVVSSVVSPVSATSSRARGQ